jgi:hypothetical protein
VQFFQYIIRVREVFVPAWKVRFQAGAGVCAILKVEMFPQDKERIMNLNNVIASLGAPVVRLLEEGVRWFRILAFPLLPPDLRGNWADQERARLDQIINRAKRGLLTSDDHAELAALVGAIPASHFLHPAAVFLQLELAK